MNKIELIFLAQNLIKEFKKENIYLDYTLNSLNEIETYLSKTISGSRIKNNTIFKKDTDSKALALGVYLGEVIRRNGLGIRWNTENIETPSDIRQETPDGSTALTINKAYKRIYNGDSENIHHFALIMSNDLLKYTGEIADDFFDNDDKRINNYQESQVVIYSNSIKDNVVHHIYHENGIWYFSGLDELDSNAVEGNYQFKFLEEIKSEHPEFSELLIAEDKLRIIRQDDGSYRSQKQHKGLFYDSHTIPSFQGDMKLNIIQWIKYNFSKIIKSLLALIVGFLLMFKVHWLFALVFIGALLYNIWYWLTTFNKFKGGDVNPGKVISIDPPLLAIATDMRKFGGDYPILKIITTKLPSEDKIVGKVIPTVALYNDNPHGYPFWAEFHPVPVIHGISDKKRIAHIMSSFSKDSLNTLDNYLNMVGAKEEGIYKVDEDNNSWINYKHVDISKGVSMEAPSKENDEIKA
jgi:hypothetical protein